MLAVFEREFKALLRDIKAIVCSVLYVIATAVLFIVNNVVMGYPYMHSVFSNMSLVAAIIIVPVAATVITRERKKDGCAFLSVLPLTSKDVTLGKFLAVFCFFSLPLSVLAVYPIVLLSMGGGGFLQSYVMLFMLVILQAFIIALSVFFSAFCKKSWKAILFTYITLVGLFLLGMLSSLFSGFIEQALRFISPFRRFDPIVFDLFDFSSLFFYLSFAALFLFAAIIGYKNKGKWVSAPKKDSRGALIAAGLFAIVLVLNVGMMFIPSTLRQADISVNKVYAVSKDTKNYLNSLDDEITVYLVDPSGGEEKLHNFIRRYCQSSGNITLKEIDTQKDTEFLAKYGQSAVPLYTMIIESKKTGRYDFVTANDYFLHTHSEAGDMSPNVYSQMISQYSQMYEYYIALYESNQASAEDVAKIEEYLYSLATETTLCINAEKAMSSAIEYVTAPYVPAYYFLSGHGENAMKDMEITVQKLDAMTPSEAAQTLVIINAPTQDYSASELSSIQKFSDNGGKLLFITGEQIKDMPNIQRLLFCFGLSAEEGVVTVNGSADVSAVVNTESDVLQNSSIASLKMSKVNSIISQQVGELKYSPLLTVSVPVENTSEEENTPKEIEKTVAIAVTDGDTPKAIWLTGADNFNKITDGMTDEEKKEYSNAGVIMRQSTLWLWPEFPYALKFSVAKTYSPLPLIVASEKGVLFGTVFIGLVPIALVSGAYLNIYLRRKRSTAVKISE